MLKIWSKLFNDSTYDKKKRIIKIPCKSLELAKIMAAIGGPKAKRTGRTVIVDLKHIKDADEALSLIEIIAKVK